MIICRKCGGENPLGRVFCGACGGKLDLNALSPEMVGEAVRRGWFRRNWKWFALGGGVLAVVVVVMSLWVTTGRLGADGTRGGMRRIESVFRKLAVLQKGDTRDVAFTESDINAYFEFKGAKEMGVDSLTVDVQNGFLYARMVKTWFGVGDFSLGISHTVRCGAAGGRLRVVKAKMGKVALMGPLKSISGGGIEKKLQGRREWKLLKTAKKIKIYKEKIHVTFRK